MPEEDQRKFSHEERKLALERAGYRCQWCRTAHSQSTPLTIHHAHIWDSSAKYYHIPGQLVAAASNAVVLCESCHGSVHRYHHQQTVREIIEGIQRVAEKENLQELARAVLLRLRECV